jgi:tRNA(adenine34) deaminase
MDIHSPYMQRCLELAAEAAAQGESPVGSIIVKDGVILGAGRDGAAWHFNCSGYK